MLSVNGERYVPLRDASLIGAVLHAGTDVWAELREEYAIRVLDDKQPRALLVIMDPASSDGLPCSHLEMGIRNEQRRAGVR